MIFSYSMLDQHKNCPEAARQIFIYGLTADGEYIRYVGVTKRSLDYRLWEHLYEARRGVDTRKCRWIRKCLRENRRVRIVRIMQISESGWAEWEQALIDHIPNLTNTHGGGRGAVITTAETRARMSAAKKLYKFTEQHKASLVAAWARRKNSGWVHPWKRRASLEAQFDIYELLGVDA